MRYHVIEIGLTYYGLKSSEPYELFSNVLVENGKNLRVYRGGFWVSIPFEEGITEVLRSRLDPLFTNCSRFDISVREMPENTPCNCSSTIKDIILDFLCMLISNL